MSLHHTILSGAGTEALLCFAWSCALNDGVKGATTVLEEVNNAGRWKALATGRINLEEDMVGGAIERAVSDINSSI